MTSCVSRRWATHSEYIDLLNYIIERTETVESPMNIMSLAREFKEKSGATQSVGSLVNRIETLRTRIQSYEHIDKNTKVKVLFALSSSVYVYFLGELRAALTTPARNQALRKDAVVEVDDLNRITKYEANDGRLTLYGDHSRSAKRKSDWIERKKKRNAAKKYYNFGDDDDDKSDEEIDHSEEDSDEYSSEEFDSDDHNNHMDEFSETKKDDGGNRKNNKNSKRKNMCSTASASENKRNKNTTRSSTSNWTGLFSNNSMRPNELDDYDTNYSIDDSQVKLEPFRGSIQEDLNEFKGDEDIQQISKSLQAHHEHNELMDAPIKSEHEDQIEEVPIKKEHEEPVEVKPETNHNSKIKFFEAMHSLILCLDTPSLSWIQSKINQKIQKLGRSDEMILNDEIVLIIELLIFRMTNDSVVNLTETAESVNFSNFLCYLKAAILNSKMSRVDGLVKNISKLIEESQNKRIPVEDVANAVCTTLNIDGF